MISDGVDIGQRRDHSAIVRCNNDLIPGKVVVTRAVRLKLGVDYRDQAKGFVAASAGADALVLDASGVGRAVLDSVRERRPDAWGLTITGGSKARIEREEREAFVGKAGMVQHLQAMMFHGLLVAEQEDLHDELRRFANKGGKLEASSGHDDLVMALCLSLMGLKLERLVRERRAA
jgi:hypothetical protein